MSIGVQGSSAARLREDGGVGRWGDRGMGGNGYIITITYAYAYIGL